MNTFDTHAHNYDRVFTNSNIGRAQRERVFKYVSKYISIPSLAILEINCGTGEDANFLSQKGHTVIATDISEKMIEVSRSKYPELTFMQLDITQLNEESFAKSFDLIFSNFGGLNCLSPNELSTFFKNAGESLDSHGKMALVIMPKKCLWERCYFLLKGDLTKAKRRRIEGPTMAKVEGENVPTWYYNPQDVVTLAKDKFKTLEVRPIGITIPPSYLENYITKRMFLFRILIKMEKWFHARFWSAYADHFLIIFQKK